VSKPIDLLIVCPGNSQVIYQALGRDYAAIEPPIWAALIANFARRKGYEVHLLDQEGEGLTVEKIVERAVELHPRLTAIVVYGQQPSASTQNMTMAEEIASALRKAAPNLASMLLGGHPSALPEQTLRESAASFVCQGEGPLTIDALLQALKRRDETDIKKVPGLWYRENGHILSTRPAPPIPQKELPTTLAGLAWDLLPMKAYRAHNWHCFSHLHQRKPYASLYTSLGCPFKCAFCCINAPFGKPGIRYWDPDFVISELDVLATRCQVKNLKIADEMFVLNEQHVLKICDRIIERGFDFNIWAYARVDTVKPKFLEKLKRAGFRWLCLGIESGSKKVRDEACKGHFDEKDIVAVVTRIREAGIHVLGNFIFGLPNDDYETMQRTLDLAFRLKCEMVNFTCAMAYPGSELYSVAQQKKWPLPGKWQDFSQHSRGQLPLPTEHISSGEVLSFRDRAWEVYFTSPTYLKHLGETFGSAAVEHVKDLTRIRLIRDHAAPLRVEPKAAAKSEPPAKLEA
jgi:radical SAM superfamily enzyme YgiQ (UPF0313 family)